MKEKNIFNTVKQIQFAVDYINNIILKGLKTYNKHIN